MSMTFANREEFNPPHADPAGLGLASRQDPAVEPLLKEGERPGPPASGMELQAILRHARVARPIDVWLALFQGLLQW